MKVYIGTDPKDWLAYEVCVRSIYAHTKETVEIIPIRDHELRAANTFWRSYHVESSGQMIDDRDGKQFSSLFSFQRFCVPMMNQYKDERVIFMDPDMMLRCDITEILDYAPNDKSVSVVQHTHIPEEATKLGGIAQTLYHRKNWSSLMVMNTAKCKNLNPYNVNNKPGSWLHALGWVSDDEIGSMPEVYNWLDGWSSPYLDPQVVHFTRGTPDLEPDICGYQEEWMSYVTKEEIRHAA